MAAEIKIEPLDYYDPEWNYYWELFESETGERLNGGLGTDPDDCVMRARTSYYLR